MLGARLPGQGHLTLAVPTDREIDFSVSVVMALAVAMAARDRRLKQITDIT